ncbi:MAG: hypothetical protein MHM6MM_009702 [Cercozoa sp. M6MM]
MFIRALADDNDEPWDETKSKIVDGLVAELQRARAHRELLDATLAELALHGVARHVGMGERSPTSSVRVVDTSDKSVDIRVVFACSHFFVVVLERDVRRVTVIDSLSQVMRGAWEAVLEVHAALLLDGGHTEWTFRCVVVEVQSTNECLLRAFSLPHRECTNLPPSCWSHS